MSTSGKASRSRIRISKPFRAVAYRARVQSFESLRYLDLRALARARQATIELGVAETRKGPITVVAHIRNGAIIALAPKGCDECFARKGKKPSKAAFKSMVHAFERAGLKKLGGPRLPIKIGSGAAARLRMASIIIIDIDIHWFDLCVTYISDDGSICVWCVFGPSFCVDAISGA